MKNILELFAGSRSFGREAEKIGHNVFSVDWTKYDGIDLQMDIEQLTPEMIPFVPDHVHASFDCTTYTIAAISHHRNGIEPKSEYAAKCDRVNQHVLNLIKNWGCTYTIENPRGMLSKMPFMQDLPKYEVWYCQYGDDRAKPSHIFTNLPFKPRPICHNGNKNCHHQPAPRGAKTGTQGRKGSYERSKIPPQLCIDLINLI